MRSAAQTLFLISACVVCLASTSNRFPKNVALAADGTVIFNDFFDGTVGVLSPMSNLIREWTVPTASSSPVNVGVLDRGVVAFR